MSEPFGTPISCQATSTAGIREHDSVITGSWLIDKLCDPLITFLTQSIRLSVQQEEQDIRETDECRADPWR
ncbi:hypothetical protein MPL1032_200043 [Mesorhizobium plurifarium]|uniref:Uncharacterized protein n=1 Tax=Mesorhizobium plurifarium TaxID=69974 RepID=A0A0K2VYU6_MESPL|nr:hypothetical protein MPL1032_200043 [Mesorhizobium plurifarium]